MCACCMDRPAGAECQKKRTRALYGNTQSLCEQEPVTVIIESASTNLNPLMLVEVPCKSPTGLAQKVLFQVQRCRLNKPLQTLHQSPGVCSIEANLLPDLRVEQGRLSHEYIPTLLVVHHDLILPI